jgi:hypothetical protein
MKRLVLLLALVACSKSGDGEHRQKHEDRAEPQTSITAFSIAVTIGDKHETWTPETFSKVEHVAQTNKSGQDRETWSLREIAKILVGPTARVTTVTGSNGTKAIDQAAWGDPARTPIVHLTRRGALKFRWASGDGTWSEAEVHDVSALEVQP